MNNEQFRKLLLANSAKGTSKQSNGSGTSPGGSGGGGGNATPSTLGSKQRSSIPMTPRSVGGAGRVDFARQLSEQQNKGDQQQQERQKKFRSFVPRGVRYTEGYVDRSKARTDEDADDRAARIHALEGALKNDEIDEATFDRLRSEIAGGDLSSTHLVKGLDYKLLQRVRKGEDVYTEGSTASADAAADAADATPDPGEDVDDEFDRFEKNGTEKSDAAAVNKDKTSKKGQLALVPGKKRTRAQFLAELKAARQAAKAKGQAGLGTKFKKIGGKKAPGSRIERDSKGREVLIIVDEDGNEKRKVRKIDPQAAKTEALARQAFIPDKNAQVLGMDVPEFYRRKQQEEEERDEDDDIFDDVDSDYDPLKGMDSDSDEGKSDAEKETGREDGELGSSPEADLGDDTKSMPPPPKPASTTHARNYFKDSKTKLVSEEVSRDSSLDPGILAALRKAKEANRVEEEDKKKTQDEKLRQLLERGDRDAEDMDMGFGSSRTDDVEDMEERQIKLSAWGEEDDDDGGRGEGKSKRKRGPKRKKGDVNSASDILGVIERRKGSGS